MKNIDDVYALSPMQQGMLFNSLYASKANVYFEQLSCTFYGAFNVLAFKQVWQRVVERHAVLRTAFIWEGLDEPLQVVRQHVTLPWEQQNWLHLTSAEQKEHLDIFFQTSRETNFELFRAPLLRLALFQVAENVHYFVLSHHHLLIDGWSLSIILKEVFAFYEAFNQGKDLFLDNPRPYRDYIAWLQQQNLFQAEEFWRKVLKGFTVPTPLPVDKFCVNAQPDHKQPCKEQSIQLSKEVTAKLQSLARRHCITLNTIVQGVWALLLSRYSGEEDVVFGVTVSGRPTTLLGVESMVGLFINTLPMRVRVSEDTFLLPWLQQLQTQHVEQEQYSYSPLVEIQTWSEVPGSTPLFESIVVFENYPIDESLQEGNSSLKISDVQTYERTDYPLVLSVAPDSELYVLMSYEEQRFEASTIIRMLGHFQTLLEGIVANPEQHLSELPLLSKAEQHQMLVEWNNTQVEYPQSQCIHQLFEAQVERTPNAVAVVFEDQHLTYQELNNRANQLAHYLQGLGVEPEVLVGLCVQRSLEMVIGLLGILKAGGAYLPLDPSYPIERLAFIFEDTQLPVLLTQEILLQDLPSYWGRIVCLDTDWEMIAAESHKSPATLVNNQNLAYTIYTSGSTGKPKGVLVQHRGLCNMAEAQLHVLGICSDNHILQFASPSFDASIFEVVMALRSGAQLHLLRRDICLPGTELLQLLNSHLITTVTMPPSVLGVLPVEKLPTLQTIIAAGEACPGSVVKRWTTEEHRQFFNAYGPTETTIWATIAKFVKTSDDKPVIGRSISNTQVYILDSYLRPVAIGVAGELHIGGEGLARGYLNRPDLTAERFIPNPFSNQPGVRLYKTGDLARYLPDGNIEFLGRLDNQVKIHGFRIELGEIEVVIAQHPQVRESVVTAREGQAGDKYLVAYIVPFQEAPTPNDLRSFLAVRLPNYMVPATFVALEEIPLTPNGKVDRQALPASDQSQKSSEAAFVPPRDTLELRLAQMWAEVLDIQTVGIKEHFFEIGGHSLLAVRLMALIHQQIGINLPLATLFQSPTIEKLATTLRQQSNLVHWSPLVPIQLGGSSKRPFFCVPGAGGNVFYFYELARYLGSDQPFYGLQAVGLDGESEPHTRVEDMASCYIKALQCIQRQGPYLLGGHSFGSKVAFEMSQQLQRQGHEVALLVVLDSSAPIPPLNQPVDIDWDDARWLIEVAKTVENFFGRNLEISYKALQSLSPDEQLVYFKERLQRASILPPEAGLAQVRGLVRVFKANYQTKYFPQNPYPTRITLFRASEVNHEEEEATIESSQEILLNPAWGWDKFSVEPVKTHFVPGDHLTMMTQPYVQDLAQQLKNQL